MNELKKIKNLRELKSLVVDGNPLCDNYSNSQTGYVRYRAPGCILLLLYKACM